MKAYIYKITNPSGKIYIGSTINIKDRIYRYKTNRVKNQIKISRSINKYGWENHLFEVIYECDASEKLFYENKFGIEYNVISKNGLNCSIPKGDDAYECMSLETKIKIGLAHKGKVISDEQKKKTSINTRNWLKNNKHPMSGATPWNKGKSFLKGEKNPMYGVKRSDDWKESHSKRMMKINKRGSMHFKSKLVVDVINGIFYDNVKEASDFLNINYSTLKGILRKGNNNRYNLYYA